MVKICAWEDEPCDREVIAKGLCRRHYKRRWRAENRSHYLSTKRDLRNRDPWERETAVGVTLETSPPCTYKQAHYRVHFARGPASAHLCGCGKAAVEWAYRPGGPLEQSEVRRDGRSGKERTFYWSPWVAWYDAMCHGCHVKADRQEAFIRAQEAA